MKGKRFFKHYLPIVADMATILGAVATIAGILIGVNVVIDVRHEVMEYTKTQSETAAKIKRDTVIIVIRDTIVPNKSPVNKPPKKGNIVQKWIDGQDTTIKNFVKEKQKEIDDFLLEQQSEIENFKNQ